jgi:hypothetical protein
LVAALPLGLGRSRCANTPQCTDSAIDSSRLIITFSGVAQLHTAVYWSKCRLGCGLRTSNETSLYTTSHSLSTSLTQCGSRAPLLWFHPPTCYLGSLVSCILCRQRSYVCLHPAYRCAAAGHSSLSVVCEGVVSSEVAPCPSVHRPQCSCWSLCVSVDIHIYFL